MNRKKIIFIILVLVINICIIYWAFLVGKSQSALTDSQIKCLASDIVDGKVIISEEQAMCLARNGEIIKACGVSCPIKKTLQNSTEFTLKSFRKAIVKNTSFEFEEKVGDLGVRFVEKSF